jgi:hypothetical protein
LVSPKTGRDFFASLIQDALDKLIASHTVALGDTLIIHNNAGFAT